LIQQLNTCKAGSTAQAERKPQAGLDDMWSEEPFCREKAEDAKWKGIIEPVRAGA
jgi:hypothetical protein